MALSPKRVLRFARKSHNAKQHLRNRIIYMMEKHDVYLSHDGTIFDPTTGQRYGKKTVKAEPEYEKKTPIKKTGGRKKKPKRNHVFSVVSALICILAICVTIASLYITYNLRGIPDLDLSKRINYSQASELYDQDGNYLMSYGTAENIDWVSIDDTPENLQNAFIAIEDKRFYSHHGIDIKRTAGAIWGQLTGTASYGGSTITQQLIKNQFLSNERTYKRKIQEWALALQIERKLSKKEILEWYMNTCFMGGNTYGIGRAAQAFFGKSVSDLTLRECAAIAGTVQAPNLYSPRESWRNGDMSACNERTDTVLYAMHDQGMITDAEFKNALNESLTINEAYTDPVSVQYGDTYYDNAYFIDYALKQTAQKMAEADYPDTDITDEILNEETEKLKNGGYKIYLTIDTDMQKTVQDIISSYRGYPSTKTGQPVEASAIVEDQHTGELKAIIGGRNKATTIGGFNRAIDSTQGVGSSIKPLSVYAPALELGDYPGSVVLDTAEKIEGYDTEQGYPDGAKTGGPITMRRALELSHNTPAVRFLLQDVTIDKSAGFLEDMGFDPDHISKTASGLALGATDVTTLEMTAGYATLANGGMYIEPHAFTRIEDRNGNVVLDDSMFESRRVFDESTAWLITDMLETNMTEGLGTRARLANVKSAAKTGTNEDKVVSLGGYTAYYTSFLRISMDDYTGMRNATAFANASPLWKSYMDAIHNGDEFDPDKDIQDVTAEQLGIEQYYVCSNSGLLATDTCRNAGYAHMEYATSGSAPTEYCHEHTYSTTYNTCDEACALESGYWDMEGNWHGPGWWDENGYHQN